MPVEIRDVLVVVVPIITAATAWWLGGRQKQTAQERKDDKDAEHHLIEIVTSSFEKASDKSASAWERYEKLIERYSELAVQVEKLQGMVHVLEERVKVLTTENDILQARMKGCEEIEVENARMVKELGQKENVISSLMILADSAALGHPANDVAVEKAREILDHYLTEQSRIEQSRQKGGRGN